jgi:hypothetical protein
VKLTNNFYLKEFIDPETYKQYGDSSIWFIDEKIINIAQRLRDRLGVVLYINTWFIPGGSFAYSGFRPPGCQVGATRSQHCFGRAIDIKTVDNRQSGAQMIRDEITTHYKTYKDLGLTTIEHEDFAPTWCHLDTRQTKQKSLKIIKP